MIELSAFHTIHCIGIGGIGLSAIAEILLQRGYRVTGSDMRETEITLHLQELGATIYFTHRAEHVEGADLVVYSAAVGKDNPEILRAMALGIPVVSRAEMLGCLMDEYDLSIAVSGTHGKTTTTSMVSLILNAAGLSPTILVGGILPEIGGNVQVGEGPYFITEACEYMDSFLRLRPKTEIILNIDSDHLDYFKDIDHIADSFARFAALVPETGTIVAYDANPFVAQVTRGLPNVIYFGLNEASDYCAKDIEFDHDGMPAFDVLHDGVRLQHVHLAVPGEHNVLNALAAFACCHHMGIEADLIGRTLQDFHGTQRRFDIVGTTPAGVRVVDDYAHHPTEIRATLAAARRLPHERLLCVFQPHTYTRTLALFDEFAEALAGADVLVLAEIYAAREKNIHKISAAQLAARIRELYPLKTVLFLETFEEITDYLVGEVRPGDMVITMGAGDIYKVGEMFLARAGAAVPKE